MKLSLFWCLTILFFGASFASADTALMDRFSTSFESGQPQAVANILVIAGVDAPTCQVGHGTGRHGGDALVLTATPQPASPHPYVYFDVFAVNLEVKSNTVLRYWLRPGSASGAHTGLDLLFSDGTALRDLGLSDMDGRGVHPGVFKGLAGRWTEVEVPLGPKTVGKTITHIMFAFDNFVTTDPIKAAVDDIEIGEAPAAVHSDIQMPRIFGDNMVLQRSRPVNLWGSASPGEALTVSVGSARVKTKAGANGQWRAVLPPHAAGGPFNLVVKGHTTFTLHNILFGEVWLCSGQSNMEGTVGAFLTPQAAEHAILAADHPQIRLFTVQKAMSQTPVHDVGGQWLVCQPETVGNFSATGYFFGQELQRVLKVPIGLICSSWGGTVSQAWTSRSALAHDPNGKSLLFDADHNLADYPAALQLYQQNTLPAWQQSVAQAQKAGQPAPPQPVPPADLNDPNIPTNLFNGMIAPLIPYTLRGVAWYQGESNANFFYQTQQYKTLFPTLIRDWRARWGEGSFPFLYCQIANFTAPQTAPIEDTNWPFLREAQRQTLSLPSTGMSLTIDLNNEPDNIHPRNKQETGRRLALVALDNVYGHKLVSSGPVFQKMTVAGSTARLSFTHTEGGLVAHGTPAYPKAGSKPQGFAIAGTDRHFAWANVKIQGDTLLLSSPQVPHPTAVRYDWAMNPIGNLYNGAGLPALPFRTDTNTGLPFPTFAFADGKIYNALSVGRFGADSLQSALDTDFIGESHADPHVGTVSGGLPWQAETGVNKDIFFTASRPEKIPTKAYAIYYSCWINSPVDLTGADPNAPKINITLAMSKQGKFLLNGTLLPPTAAGSAPNGSTYIYNAIPLKKGGNHFLVKVVSDTQIPPGFLAWRIDASDPAFLGQLQSAVQRPAGQ